jgi:hypothetical protein
VRILSAWSVDAQSAGTSSGLERPQRCDGATIRHTTPAFNKPVAAKPEDTSIDAEVDLALTAGTFELSARLNVHLPGIEVEVAQSIADAAHQICPYSRATRGNIDVTITVS